MIFRDIIFMSIIDIFYITYWFIILEYFSTRYGIFNNIYYFIDKNIIYLDNILKLLHNNFHINNSDVLASFKELVFELQTNEHFLHDTNIIETDFETDLKTETDLKNKIETDFENEIETDFENKIETNFETETEHENEIENEYIITS